MAVRQTLGVLALLVLSGLSGWVGGAPVDPLRHELPVMGVMPGMHTKWVAERMSYNGVPMSVRNFSVHRSVDDVLHYYESAWKTVGLGRVAHSRAGDFKTLGLRQGGYYYTVQVRDTPQGAEGSLVVTAELEQPAYDTATRFPLAPGTQVLTKIEALDQGTRVETLITANNRSVSANEIWMAGELKHSGWVRQSWGEPSAGEKRVLSFQKGDQLCQITLVGNSTLQQGQTMVMIHWIKGK